MVDGLARLVFWAVGPPETHRREGRCGKAPHFPRSLDSSSRVLEAGEALVQESSRRPRAPLQSDSDHTGSGLSPPVAVPAHEPGSDYGTSGCGFPVSISISLPLPLPRVCQFWVPVHMDGWRWIGKAAAAAAVAFLLLSTAPPGGARREPDVNNNGRNFVFNYTLAKAVVEYAAAVYMTDLTALYTWTCSRCNDLTRGFEMTCIIVDVQNCLQAFVGVDHNLNAIIVSIRGTQENSVQNWIKDIIWKQVNLNYPNMPNAKVHIGFYSSYNNTVLRPAITNAVRKARKLHGHSNIIVTGHSMGGAIASFCALDLAMSFGSNNVHLMTFGQPRVGNAAFASYFAKYVTNTIRMTHERDIVPHLPPYFFFLPQLTYKHFPREVWEHEVDGNTTYQVCDGSGEDPNCCRSVFVLLWSASDHLTYMGVEIAADDWSTCRIVLGQSVEQLKGSLASDIVMSGLSVDVVIADDSVQVE